MRIILATETAKGGVTMCSEAKARHEYKVTINMQDHMILRSRLRHVLKCDANINKEGVYAVRSLYFDTPKDKALREKIDGVNRREKFRLRLYNGDSSFIRLEKKSKINSLCYKESEAVTSSEVRKLLKCDYSWMQDENRPLILELYTKMMGEGLQPRTIVEYKREPFVFPAGNVRITLDSEIKTGMLSKDFLNEKAPLVSIKNGATLMEVKYDEFLPEFIKRLVNVGNRRTGAFSKYAAARMYE